MTKTNYTAIITQLEQVAEPNCDTAHPFHQVARIIDNSDLPTKVKQAANNAAHKAANPSGWHYIGSGAKAAIKAIEANEQADKPTPVNVSPVCLGKVLNDHWTHFYVITGNPTDTKIEFGHTYVYGKQIERTDDYDLYINELYGLVETLNAANDDSFDPEPPKTLTAAQLTTMVANGKIFGVSFIKRTTGELRTMSCRLGVKKFLRGGKLAYSPSEKQLLTVFSMNDNGYRSIPLDSIKSVSVSGQSFVVGGAA